MPLPPVPLPSPSQNLSPGAYITHPPISSPHIYVHGIIPDLSHWPEYIFLPNPQYSLCTSSQILTKPYCLSFRLDTSPTFAEHHSRIIFGDLIRVVGGVSDVAMQRTRPAAELVSPTIDNFIIGSVPPIALLLNFCL